MVILVLPRSAIHRRPGPTRRFLVDDQGPVVRIGDVNEEGVVALGDREITNHEVGIGVEGGGGLAPARHTG